MALHGDGTWTRILKYAIGYWQAAGQLFEQLGRQEMPTVDAVRKLSKTSMNDASAVMREWRRSQIVAVSAAVGSVPEKGRPSESGGVDCAVE